MAECHRGAECQRDRDCRDASSSRRRERSTAWQASSRARPRLRPGSSSGPVRQPARPARPARQEGRREQGQCERDGEHIGRPGAMSDEELGVVAKQVEQGLGHGNRPQGSDVEPHDPTHALSIAARSSTALRASAGRRPQSSNLSSALPSSSFACASRAAFSWRDSSRKRSVVTVGATLKAGGASVVTYNSGNRRSLTW